jgi:hypothetical protein
MDFIPKVQVVKEDKVEEQPFQDREVEAQEDDREAHIEEVIKEMAEPPNGVKKEEPCEATVPVENIFEEPQKLTKAGKPRKKRRPLTEEEKERLAKAREKATEARRRKAAEKREAKEMENKEKELLKKQRKKKLDDLEKSLETKEEKVEKVLDGVKEKVETPIVKEVKPVKEKEVSFSPTQGLFTKKDLDDAVLNGIMGYEKIRKERKSKKKMEEEKAKEQQQLKKTLSNAINRKPYNPYAGVCY